MKKNRTYLKKNVSLGRGYDYEHSEVIHAPLTKSFNFMNGRGGFFPIGSNFLKQLSVFTALSVFFLPPPLSCAMDSSDFSQESTGVMEKKKISKSIPLNLRLRSDQLEVYVPNLPWPKLKSYLENLVQLTWEDSLCEQRIIYFNLLGRDLARYSEWDDCFLTAFCHSPFSVRSGSNGAQGKKIDGIYESYNTFLILSNRTQKEKRARKIFPYRYLEGFLDPKKINEKVFIDLMVNAGFKPEDFSKGKYDYQDHIYVKPFFLKNPDLSDCALSMEKEILSTLAEASHPYVAFVAEVDKNLPFTAQDVGKYGGRESFFHTHGNNPMAKLYVPNENRIYIAYFNDKRGCLNLHGDEIKRKYCGLSVNEAKMKVENFIKEKYDNFETECLVITGKGNHINPDGTSGILKESLPLWLQGAPLKPYIKKYHLEETGGAYRIFLKIPGEITLTSNNLGEDINKTIYIMEVENQRKNKRLRILYDQNNLSYVEHVVIQVITKLQFYTGTPNFPGFISLGTRPDAYLITWGQRYNQNNLSINLLEGPNYAKMLKFENRYEK